LTKKTVLEIVIILLIVIPVGIIYNISNPDRIPFIREENEIDFSQNDSLLNVLRVQDSLQKIADSLKQNSISREDSLRLVQEQKIKDSLETVSKQDSTKRVNDSLKAYKQHVLDSINNAKKENDFAKPIDIKIDFAKALYDKNYQFIDSRDAADFNAGSIKGSMNIPYHNFEQYKSKLEALPKEKVYVIFCSSGCDVSIDLAYAMARMGFTKLYVFHGGWDTWKEAGYPAN
jgi:rhodanese-related sulfurtransferase